MYLPRALDDDLIVCCCIEQKKRIKNFHENAVDGVFKDVLYSESRFGYDFILLFVVMGEYCQKQLAQEAGEHIAWLILLAL